MGDGEGGTLELEQFAAITAAIDAGVARDQALAEAGVSNEIWAASQELWLSRLAAQASRGKFRLERKLRELVEKRRRALAAEPRARRKRAGPAPVAPSARLGELAGRRTAARVPTGLAMERPAHERPEPPKGPKTRPPHDETGVFMSPAPRQVLPFKPPVPARANAPVAPVAPPAPPLARVAPPQPTAKPPPSLAETSSFVSPALAAREPLPFKSVARPPTQRRTDALPFKPPRQPGLSADATARIQAVTLAQYAKLCAMVRGNPANAAEIRTRYGLDGEAWTALHALWQERMKSDPALRTRWQHLVDQHLARGNV